MTKFQFVVSNGARERPSAGTRSHAVRSGLQRKNNPGTSSGSENSQLTIRQRSTLKGRFRISSTPAKTSKTSEDDKEKDSDSRVVGEGSIDLRSRPAAEPEIESHVDTNTGDIANELEHVPREANTGSWGLVKSPSQGWNDPFNAFTVPQNPEVDKLMKFFITRFDLEVAISHVQEQWWGYAVSDPLLMHTTLSLAAATWSMFLPKPDTVMAEGVKQKGLAIRGIQQRLDKCYRDDALVGAVANLANIEAVEGNFNVAHVHLKGLELLFNKRGGSPAFRHNINIARAVNWSDLQAAAGLDVKPLFPLIIPLDSISLPASVLAAAERPSLSHIRVFEENCEDTTLRFNFAVLRQAHYALKSKEVLPDDLRILINAADHQLASSLADTKVLAKAQLMLTAARLFLWVVIRETRPLCLIPRLILGRLRQQLQASISQLSAHQEYWHGLLWCLVVGAAAAHESNEDFDFFSIATSKAISMMQLGEAMEIEAVARRYLWDESFPGNFLATYGPNLFLPRIKP